MILFLTMLERLICDNGNFYMYQTQPYVLELNTQNEEVKLSKTSPNSVEISHKDPYTQQWSAPKPLHTDGYSGSKHQQVDLNQHDYTHNNHIMDNNWKSWNGYNNYTPMTYPTEAAYTFTAQPENDYTPNMVYTPANYGMQPSYNTGEVQAMNQYGTDGMTFAVTSAGAAGAGAAGAGAVVQSQANQAYPTEQNAMMMEQKENVVAGVGTTGNDKSAESKKDKSGKNSDKKSSKSDSKKNTSSSTNKSKKNGTGDILAFSCVATAVITCFLITAM